MIKSENFMEQHSRGVWATLIILLVSIPIFRALSMPVYLSLGVELFLVFTYWIYSTRKNIVPKKPRKTTHPLSASRAGLTLTHPTRHASASTKHKAAK
jgi:hypothetical protein